MPPNEWTNDIKPALALYPISPKIYVPRAVTKSEHAPTRMNPAKITEHGANPCPSLPARVRVASGSLFGFRNTRGTSRRDKTETRTPGRVAALSSFAHPARALLTSPQP